MKLFSSPVFAFSCLALACSTTAIAAERVDLKGHQEALVNSYLVTGLTTESKQNELKVLSTRKDFKGVTHKRMQQYYQGSPVFGGYVISHQSTQALNGKNQSFTANGALYKNLKSDLGMRPQGLETAAKKLLASRTANFKKEQISREQSEVMVYVDDNDVAHWAFKISFMVNTGKGIPKIPTEIVDAKTLKPFVTWNDIKTLKQSAEGVGFGGNERVGKYTFGDDFPALEISRDKYLRECYMENTDVKVVDMDGRYWSDNRAMSFPCAEAHVDNQYLTGHNSDGYDEVNGAYSPSNDALYIGYVIKHLYREWYDLPVLVNDNGSLMQLVMRVHYGDDYENAFWDGEQMTYGDGGSWMYPLVSLGVGAHEVSHGFTEQNSGLQYYGQSGGMNESFSDMAAQAAQFYSEGKNSWKIGERIMKESSGYEALRYMDKPSRDGASIDTADEYYNGLDVHYSSGVYNHLFYLLANEPGWNVRKAFDVMVKANQDYWTPWSSFQKGACGVLSATRDFGYDVGTLNDALNQVALTTNQC